VLSKAPHVRLVLFNFDSFTSTIDDPVDRHEL